MYTLIVVVAMALVASVSAGPMPCDLCTFIVQTVDSYVQSHETVVIEKLEMELNKICMQLGRFETECKAMIAQSLPDIVDAVAHLDADEVCEQLHLCGNGNVRVITVADTAHPLNGAKLGAQKVKENVGDVSCEACEFVVQWAEDYMQNHENATVQQVVEQLEIACTWTGPYEDMCKQWVEKEVPIIMKYLENMDPTQVCHSLGACTQAVVRLSAALKKQTLKTPSTAGCVACSLVVGYAQAYVANHETVIEDKLKATLEDICMHLPDYRLECKMVVDNYLTEVLHYIEDGLTPNQICEEIHLCPKSKAAPAVAAHVNDAPLRAFDSDEIPCKVCEFAVQYVEDYLRTHKGATVQQVQDALKTNVCAHLGSMQDKCNALVDAEVPALIDALANMPAAAVCKTLHVCDDDGARVRARSAVLEKSNGSLKEARRARKAAKKALEDANLKALPCDVCEFVVGYIESYIRSHPDATIKQIEDVLEKNVCAHLGSLQAECNMIVESEVPAIVDALKTLPPDQVCSQVHLCT